MKQSMSNIDIRLALKEIQEVAEGAFIKNVYQYGDVFVLKLYQPAGGTTQLLIQPGSRVHLTEFRRSAPRVPPHFCAALRKYLRDRRISTVRQHDLDRIVIIEIGDEDSTYKLVAELFGNGNLLLLDPEDTIFIAMHYRRMRDRAVVPKAKYLFPPPRGQDIFGLDDDTLQVILSESTANVVRTLASRLNLDSLSCEEVCALAGVSPKAKVTDLREQELLDLKGGLRQFIERIESGVDNPAVVHDDSELDDDELEPIAFIPFPFEVYTGMHLESFENFSKAIDEFFGVAEIEQAVDEQRDAMTRERDRLQRIIHKQQESIERLEKKAEKLRIEGELIYTHFQIVQEVLDTIRQARTGGMSWTEIRNTVEEGKEKGNKSALLIERIVPSQGQIVVNLDGVQVVLDIRLNAQDNASLAYEQSKKSKSKVEGARKQIEKTKKKLEDLSSITIEETIDKQPVRIRKRKWYEKFRWFLSSEGFLVLGGRDVKTNERLAKRQMGANDVFLHAALHGAPYIVIKVPESPPGEQTLYEAAQFAVTFSRAWQDELSSGDAYWVSPEQVSFSPPTGEYLPAGAVMIYGTKNYVRRVPVELAVGLVIEGDEIIPMSGPPSAVAAQTEYNIRVAPGQTKKGQIVKEIIGHFKQILPEELRPLLSSILQEDFQRILPAGGCRLVVE